MSIVFRGAGGTATVKLTFQREKNEITTKTLEFEGCLLKKDANLSSFIKGNLEDQSANRNKLKRSEYLFYAPDSDDFKGNVTKATLTYPEISKKRGETRQKMKECTVEDPLIIRVYGHLFLCCDSQLNQSKFLDEYCKEVRTNQSLDCSKTFYGLGSESNGQFVFTSFGMSQCQSSNDLYKIKDEWVYENLNNAGPLLLDDNKTAVGCFRKTNDCRILILIFGSNQVSGVSAEPSPYGSQVAGSPTNPAPFSPGDSSSDQPPTAPPGGSSSGQPPTPPPGDSSTDSTPTPPSGDSSTDSTPTPPTGCSSGQTPTPPPGDSSSGQTPTPPSGDSSSNQPPTPSPGGSSTDSTPTPPPGCSSGQTPTPPSGDSSSDQPPTPSPGDDLLGKSNGGSIPQEIDSEGENSSMKVPSEHGDNADAEKPPGISVQESCSGCPGCAERDRTIKERDHTIKELQKQVKDQENRLKSTPESTNRPNPKTDGDVSNASVYMPNPHASGYGSNIGLVSQPRCDCVTSIQSMLELLIRLPCPFKKMEIKFESGKYTIHFQCRKEVH